MRVHEKTSGVTLLAIVTATMLLCVASRGDAQEPLRWKFQKGQKLDYKMVQDMKMAAEGGPVGQMNTSMRQVMDMTWDVSEVNENGDAVIRQKFDRIRTKMTMPLGGFEYDSQSTEAPQGMAQMLAPVFKAMTSGEFVVTMSARGEIKDVQVPEEMMKTLKNSPGAAMMGEMTSSEGFKKMITQGALVLPEEPPQQGKEWKTEVSVTNPVAGKQIVETKYRYEGTKDVDGKTYALIRPEMKMDFSKPDAAQNPDQAKQAQVPQFDMKIADQSSSGEVLFDIEQGRLHSSEIKQMFTLDMSAGGQSMKQKIDQTITVTVEPAGEGKAEAESEAASTQQ